MIRIRSLHTRRIWALFAAVAALCCHRGAAETLEIIRRIPHTGYSEGLDFRDGFLWHALPKEILKIDPKDGEIVAKFAPATEYSESILWLGSKLINVSFHDNGIYVGALANNKLAFERKGTTPEKHAWGIEKVGSEIVVTGDHSTKLYFLDATTFKLKRTIETPVSGLEDLAWDGKGIWTSSFTSHKGKIFRVNPKDGTISPFYSLPDPSECPIIDGAAFDGKNLWITGKNCTSFYYVKLPKVP